MNIGIDARIASTHRGMGRVVRYILAPLFELGEDHEFHLFMPPSADGWTPSGKNVRVHAVRGGPVPVYEQLNLPRVVDTLGPDVLWCPANTGPLRLKTPVVVTVHDVIFRHRGSLLSHSTSTYQRLGRAYTDWCATRLVQRAAHVVTVSDYSAHEIHQLLHVPAPKITAIPHGVTLVSKGEPLAQKRLLELGIDGPFIFFLGAIDPRKNTDFTIDTFLDSPVSSDTQLVIAGLGGNERSTIKARISSHPRASAVKLLEFITDEELAAMYRSCLAFVFGSLYEGFGLPVLEAMNYGAPVVASNLTSIPEVGGDAILYFDPRSNNELALALSKVRYDESLRKELSEMGLRRAAAFSWVTSARMLLDVLQAAAV